MPVNLDKPQRWKADIAESVDLYNQWFLRFAPETFRTTRIRTTTDVEITLRDTDNLRNVTAELLRQHPHVLFTLRMCTAPPIARDRLVGLADVPKSLVESMELRKQLPARMSAELRGEYLTRIARMLMRLADADLFPWLGESRIPTESEIHRAATIVADRLCGASADPIIRNAQERRQLSLIKSWLEDRGYRDMTGAGTSGSLNPGEFCFRMNVMGLREDHKPVNIPIDAVVAPLQASSGELPLFIEAKSAGDFTNTNKRRKEEATKVAQLRRKHGHQVNYILFLCGYFDSGYLGYEASEGIDWVWEHRIDDLAEFGI